MITWVALRTAVEAFLGTPAGRWTLLIAVGGAALFAGGWHERNVGWNERDVQAKKEITSLNKGWVDAEAAAIKKSKDAAALEEAAHKAQQAANDAKHAKELADEKARAKTQHDKDVADARSGALSLRVPASICAGGPDVPSSAGGRDPASQATLRLPSETSADLLSLADDATAESRSDALELARCWQTVADDRKTFSTTGVKP